jgi:hypothetical protein
LEAAWSSGSHCTCRCDEYSSFMGGCLAIMPLHSLLGTDTVKDGQNDGAL